MPRAAPRVSAHPAVTAYIDGFPPPVRERLAKLRSAIAASAPEAEERLAYGIPTWWQGENLIHIGGFKKHVGIYPGPEAIVAFADALGDYVSSKGAVQLPHDAPLSPAMALVKRLVRHRLAVVGAAGKAKKVAKGEKAAAGKAKKVVPAKKAAPVKAKQAVGACRATRTRERRGEARRQPASS